MYIHQSVSLTHFEAAIMCLPVRAQVIISIIQCENHDQTEDISSLEVIRELYSGNGFEQCCGFRAFNPILSSLLLGQNSR